MIRCHLLGGESGEIEFDDFQRIVRTVSEDRLALAAMPMEAVIGLLSLLGKAIIRDPHLATHEGATYISLWLRKDNLERICRLNLGDIAYADGFKDSGNGFRMIAQPRGIVCHWVASNVPTLSFFSLVIGILTKNGNILKVSEENKDILIALVRSLSDLSLEIDGETHSGKDIARAVAIVSFDSGETRHGAAFSMAADCKVIWGGADSVKAITALPQKETCEIIPFGPKYSFGVFDKGVVESPEFRLNLRKVLRDVLLFNQMACSSPQVLFFEKSAVSLPDIARAMEEEFAALPGKLRGRDIPEHIATNIINTRWTYLLSEDREVVESKGLDWTIFMNKEPGLEDPVHGGCVFIKEVESAMDVVQHVTRKVQAIVLCTADDRGREEFARAATEKGADRIVLPGAVHDFTLPWDGIMALNRLVRWAILYSRDPDGERNASG